MEDLVAWLDEVNRGRPHDEHVTVFHVALTAAGRTLRLRPEVNRFIAGRRTYQHRDISISFIVKTSMDDDAPESEVRVVLTGTETVEDGGRSCGARPSLFPFPPLPPRPLPPPHPPPPCAPLHPVSVVPVRVDAPFHPLYENVCT